MFGRRSALEVLIVGGDAEHGHSVPYLGAERKPGATFRSLAIVRGRARHLELAFVGKPSSDRLSGREPAGHVQVGRRYLVLAGAGRRAHLERIKPFSEGRFQPTVPARRRVRVRCRSAVSRDVRRARPRSDPMAGRRQR